MRFFDANIVLGESPPGARFDTSTPEGGLAMLDHFGVERALVRVGAQQHWSAVDGNREVLAYAAKSKRLYPVWTVLPHLTEEFPKPEDLGDALEQSGVRALYFDPSCRFPLFDPLLYGDLLGAIEEAQVPLIDTRYEHDIELFREIANALTEFPDLRLIMCVSHAAWGIERSTYPLFERFEHFRIGLCGYHISGAVQDAVRRYGAGRFVFGSGYPRLDPGGAVEYLRRLDIDDDAKRAIAAGNLEEILGEVADA